MPILLIIKKLAARVLFPLPLVIILLLAGVVMVLRRGKKWRAAGVCTILAATALLYGVGVFGNAMMEWYVSDLARLDVSTLDPRTDYMVCVAGSSFFEHRRTIAPKLRFNEAAAVRALEAARICAEMLEQDIDFKVAISIGGTPDADAGSEEAARKFFADFGVPEDRVIILDTAWTTRDEIKFFASLPGRKIMVSQPFHVPRLMDFARKYGITDAIPAPGYTYHGGDDWSNPISYVPSADDVLAAETVIYELLGRIECKLF